MAIYSLLLYLSLPVILLRLIWRGFKAPNYWQRWSERFGFFDSSSLHLSENKKTVWLHAVSVGEVLAAKPVIDAILKNKPTVNLVVTTTTPTGSDQVTQLFGDKVFHVYAPYDLPGSVNRFLTRVKPSLFLIMETEVWPNMIAACQSRQVPVVLVNGRLSEKSLNRYKKFARFATSVFQKIDTICAQSDADASRFSELQGKNIIVTGNIKSDITVNNVLLEKAMQYKQAIFANGERLVLIAASTHKGEDEMVLNAYFELKEKFPSLLLILVPRHPERFESVAELCEQKQLSVVRKSRHQSVEKEVDVLLGDTMGELFLLYGVSDVAIMGGTFVEHGGHNFLESAAWGVPVISGKSVYNFSVVAKEMESERALVQVEDQYELIAGLDLLLANTDRRHEQGRRAKEYIDKKKGALKKVLEIISPLMD